MPNTINKISYETNPLKYGTPNRIQTCNLCIRSALLYSIELWEQKELEPGGVFN